MGASDFSKLPHIGESLRRKEDYRFLTGAGQYTDDVQMANMTHAFFVRSPHAHANIRKVDIAAAKAAPGVIAVLTAKDMEAAGVGSVSGSIPFPGRTGKMPYSPFRPALAGSKVMHVGDPVALVIAKTASAAEDAADLLGRCVVAGAV
mgnify:CR=1 FL=1